MKEDHIDWMNKTEMSKAIHTVKGLCGWFCPGMGDAAKFVDDPREKPVPLSLKLNDTMMFAYDLAPLLKRFQVNLWQPAIGPNQLRKAALRLRRNKGKFFKVIADLFDQYGKQRWYLNTNTPRKLPTSVRTVRG